MAGIDLFRQTMKDLRSTKGSKPGWRSFFFVPGMGALLAFVASVSYYWRYAPAVLVLVIAPCTVIAIVRTGNVVFSKPPEPIFARTFLEGAVWLGLESLLLLHIHWQFGFLSELSERPAIASVVIIIGVFVIAYILLLLLMIPFSFIWVALESLIDELSRFREALERIGIVLALYVLIDLGLASVYQWLSFVNGGAFDSPVHSFADAFYFSTQTITILGGQDLKPLSPAAKILVSVETIIGISFLGAVLAFIIGMPTRAPRKRKPAQNTEHRGKNAAGSDSQ